MRIAWAWETGSRNKMKQIMNRKKKHELILERSHQQIVGNETQEDMLIKAQAEISFRAGREVGNSKGFRLGVIAGELLGRREVVKEYKSKSLMAYHDKYCKEEKVVILVIPRTKLREWGY